MTFVFRLFKNSVFTLFLVLFFILFVSRILLSTFCDAFPEICVSIKSHIAKLKPQSLAEVKTSHILLKKD